MSRGNPVGVGPIGWVNDDLRDWGADRLGDDVMREIAELGYDGTEMSYRFPQEPAALRAALAGHGLELAAAYRWTNFANPALQDEEIALAKAHVDFCRAAGARFATLAEGTGSLHWDRRGERSAVELLDEDGWGWVIEALHEVGRHAAETGMRVTVHPHGGTAIENEAETHRLLERLDPALVGWCLDTGHVAYGRGDSRNLLARWVGRVAYVHLKDVRSDVLSRVQAEGWTFARAVRANVFCTPGAGSLDFDPVIEALREVGYDGWFIVEAEQDPAVHDARTVGGAAREFLRERYGL